MSIHTFGDSHSKFGWSNTKSHHLGPILCYSFGNEKLKRCDISKFGLKDGDIVVFCFGEIDCRCHIHKHISKKNSYKDIINNLIINYFEAIKLNIINCKVKLKNICVYNVVPTVEKNNTEENPQYPFLGTDDERKSYVIYFNQKLKEKCIENNYIFFDIYDKYTDPNGFLNKEFSDGNVHIFNGKFITEFINNYLI